MCRSLKGWLGKVDIKNLRSIEQWYERVTNLDRHRRESKGEEKILRERKKSNN